MPATPSYSNHAQRVRTHAYFRTTWPTPSLLLIRSSRTMIAFRSNEMLAPEIAPQVHDLPRAQTNQHAHGQVSEPLYAIVRALVGIPQLLFPRAQVVHLRDNLADNLLDASQLGFDGLELLAGLDGGPVLCVGADVDVELDVAGGVEVALALCVLLEPVRGRHGRFVVPPVMMLSKHTSNAESACDVNAYLFSP